MFVRNSYYTHGFNNKLLIIILLVYKTIMVLAAVAALTGIVAIQVDLAYAVTAEKVPLVQHYEQFPGQEVTGFFDSLRNPHTYSIT